MALIKCKECGNQVSNKAKACPSCGAKVPKRVGIVGWLFVIFFVLPFAWSLGTQMAKNDPARIAPESAEQKAAREAGAAIAVAQAAIQSSLKDPESAKFSGAFYKEGTVCGYVNAKNSFGGYSGDKGFVVDEKRGIAELEGSTANFHKRWSERCATP